MPGGECSETSSSASPATDNACACRDMTRTDMALSLRLMNMVKNRLPNLQRSQLFTLEQPLSRPPRVHARTDLNNSAPCAIPLLLHPPSCQRDNGYSRAFSDKRTHPGQNQSNAHCQLNPDSSISLAGNHGSGQNQSKDVNGCHDVNARKGRPQKSAAPSQYGRRDVPPSLHAPRDHLSDQQGPTCRLNQVLSRLTEQAGNINNNCNGLACLSGSRVNQCSSCQGGILNSEQIDLLLCLSLTNGSSTDVVEECKRALLASDLNNLLTNYLTAIKYKLYDIMDKLIDRIRRNFLCVAQTRQFLCLPLEYLLVFLEDTCLNVENELDIFFIALSWIDFNKQDRICQAGKILNKVRFVFIEPEDIIRYVEPNAHLFTGQEGKEALINLYRHRALIASGLIPPPEMGRPFYKCDPAREEPRKAPSPAREEEPRTTPSPATEEEPRTTPSPATEEEPRTTPSPATEEEPRTTPPTKAPQPDRLTPPTTTEEPLSATQETPTSKEEPSRVPEQPLATETDAVPKKNYGMTHYRVTRPAGSEQLALPEKSTGKRLVRKSTRPREAGEEVDKGKPTPAPANEEQPGVEVSKAKADVPVESPASDKNKGKPEAPQPEAPKPKAPQASKSKAPHPDPGKGPQPGMGKSPSSGKSKRAASDKRRGQRGGKSRPSKSDQNLSAKSRSVPQHGRSRGPQHGRSRGPHPGSPVPQHGQNRGSHPPGSPGPQHGQSRGPTPPPRGRATTRPKSPQLGQNTNKSGSNSSPHRYPTWPPAQVYNLSTGRLVHPTRTVHDVQVQPRTLNENTSHVVPMDASRGLHSDRQKPLVFTAGGRRMILFQGHLVDGKQ